LANAPSNLAVRLATAAVAVPALLWLIYLAPPVAFFLLALAASLVGAFELFAMTHSGDRIAQALGLVATAAVSCAVYLGAREPRMLATALVLAPLIGPLVTLARLGDLSSAALRAFAMSTGPLLIAVPLTLLAIMRRDVEGGSGYVVMTLMFAWFGDTGGYFAGRFLGKHKLYEAVSPKKTVEGSLGGLGGTVLGGLLAHFWYLPGVPLAHVLPLAAAASVFGQAGDLAESLLKRSTGVKDSGAIVPGHGGILDRVDALLFTSAVVYLYTLWR
jgi:phosphatidate cytidylyltransferase